MARPAIYTRVVIPMTSDAVRHICQRKRGSYFAHRLYFPVTLLAWNVFHDMRLMVKINEIWKDIYLGPSNRLFFIPCLAYFLYFGFGSGHELMTTDARLHRGDHRRPPSSGTAVAILTAHLVLPRMDLVAECDRLTRLQFLFSAPGTDRYFEQQRQAIMNEEDGLRRQRTHFYFFLRLSNSRELHGPLPL